MLNYQFDQREHDILKKCLNALIHGPFFEDWEFNTLFGVSRSEVSNFLNRFPSYVEIQQKLNFANDECLILQNVFTNLLGYPHKNGKILEEMIGMNSKELGILYQKWKKRIKNSP